MWPTHAQASAIKEGWNAKLDTFTLEKLTHMEPDLFAIVIQVP